MWLFFRLILLSIRFIHERLLYYTASTRMIMSAAVTVIKQEPVEAEPCLEADFNDVEGEPVDDLKRMLMMTNRFVFPNLNIFTIS